MLIQMSKLKKWFERNGMAFAIVVSVAVSLILIISVYLYENSWTAAGTVALACFGAIGVAFSYVSTMELKRDRIPYVHVNFTLYEEKEHMIYVVVQNSGNAPAHDINIKVSPLKGEEELLDNNAIVSNFRDLSVIKRPIQFLPPNDSRRTLFGTAAGIGEYGPKIEYELNVTYKDSSGRDYNSYMVLDVSHLMNARHLESKDSTVEVLNGIRRELRELSDNLKQISESWEKSVECNESDDTTTQSVLEENNE